MIVFLSAAQVIAMHDILLKRWGGEEGGGHRGGSYEGVEAAIQAVKNSYYNSMKELAAAYAVYIVQGHVFMDGNKRTANASMTTFLEGNGVRYRTAPQDNKELMISLQIQAENGVDTNRLIQWIARKL